MSPSCKSSREPSSWFASRDQPCFARLCSNHTLCANLFHTRGARGNSGLNRTLGFYAPRPLPSVAGKPKNFPSFLDFRRGVWGEPTKNGKEIFGFASPFQTIKRAILF